MRLLKPLYRARIDYIYIDPPYNTRSNTIIYKNNFKHSTWLSLIDNRFKESLTYLRHRGVKTIAIDDAERIRLEHYLERYKSSYNITPITVIHNPKGSITNEFNRIHEYSIFMTPKDETHILNKEKLEGERRPMRRWGAASSRLERPLSFYPITVKDRQIIEIGSVPENTYNPPSRNVRLADGGIQVWPIDNNGIERRWNFGLDKIHANLDRLEVVESQGDLDIDVVAEFKVPKTVWQGGEWDAGRHGSTKLVHLLGEKLFSYPKSLNLVQKCIGLATSSQLKHFVLDYFAGSGTTGHATIALNREDGGNRQYILVEQGDYIDTVLIPRLKKVVYSADWKDGKPTAPKTGISHAFKVLRLESYEDTLNNLTLDAESRHGQLPTDEANEDYLLRYMLDIETQGSLLSVEDFKKPFDYEMNIATDSAGAYRRTRVDLVETFNYLIGLQVHATNYQLKHGFVTVEGQLPNKDRCLVVWRDCETLDYTGTQQLFERLNIRPSDSEYDVVYVNGDHNIPTVFQQDEAEVGHSRVLKLRQIEPEFLELMFNVEDV